MLSMDVVQRNPWSVFMYPSSTWISFPDCAVKNKATPISLTHTHAVTTMLHCGNCVFIKHGTLYQGQICFSICSLSSFQNGFHRHLFSLFGAPHFLLWLCWSCTPLLSNDSPFLCIQVQTDIHSQFNELFFILKNKYFTFSR